MRIGIRTRPAIGFILALAAIAMFAAFQSGVVRADFPLPQAMVWVDGEKFDTIVTPATFNPESDSFDQLYKMPVSPGFMGGLPLISDSKPGDTDYNGGRWHVNIFVGSDSSKYKDATSIEDLMAVDTFETDFMATGDYFECPLLPVRGQN